MRSGLHEGRIKCAWVLLLKTCEDAKRLCRGQPYWVVGPPPISRPPSRPAASVARIEPSGRAIRAQGITVLTSPLPSPPFKRRPPDQVPPPAPRRQILL